MSRKELMNSEVPSLISAALNSQSLTFNANYMYMIAHTTFAAVGDLLRANKSKENPVAFVIRDQTDSIIVAAIVRYIPSDDPEKPEGNWNYVWTFDPEDVTPDMIVADLNNQNNHHYFVTRAGNKYGMEYLPGCLIPMHTTFFSVLKGWLLENATEEDVTEIELPDVFLASAAVEDGETVISIEPIGKMVQLIKDDAVLEV